MTNWKERGIATCLQVESILVYTDQRNKMLSFRSIFSFLFFLLATSVQAFAPPATTITSKITAAPSALSASPFLESSPSFQVSVDTLDPTTVLSDVLSGVLGTPLILAVPIVAALGVAGLIAFAIVSYANPAAEDDDL